MRKLILTIGVAIACLVATQDAQAQGFKVIANSSVSTTSVSGDALSKLFLKQAKKLPDGSAAVAVDQGKDSPVREAFTKAVHGRSISAVETFWQQQIFSGKEVPPAVKNSDAEVLAFVKATAGSIGYVSAGASTDGVKVITVQ